LRRALQHVDESTRARTTAVHAAFEPYVQNDAATFTTACWLVSARATRA
jgi:hypothetical protein